MTSDTTDSAAQYTHSVKDQCRRRPTKGPESLSVYELQRLRNIQHNQAVLNALDIGALQPLAEPRKVSEPILVGDSKRRRTKSPRAQPATPLPSRTSARLRGDTANLKHTIDSATDNASNASDDLAESLLPAEEYFTAAQTVAAVRVDGHFRGWVNADIVEKYALESSAAEAWKRNGGGTFSFNDPTGTGAKRKSAKRGGVSEIKLISKQLFRKNPNAYFYRHNQPDEDQWMGDWSAEEEALFIETARKYGCGDKWGLFASYIPHRVGYQCSNHYRQVILPSGRIIDPNYRFSKSGRAIYVGQHRRV